MSDSTAPVPPERRFHRRNAGRILFAAILLLCVVVRVVGIQHGKPDKIYHPDVSKQAQVARKIFGGGVDLQEYFKGRVELAMYPYGTAVIAAGTQKMIRPFSGMTEEEILKRPTWYWARALRVFATVFGLLACGFIATILYRRHGPIAGCLSAGLLLLEPIGSQFAHYGMNDIPLAAMLVIAWWLASKLTGEFGARSLAIAGACGLTLGCAFAIKYQAVFGGIFPLVSLVALAWQKKWIPAVLYAVVIACTGILGIYLFCYNFSSAPGYFIESFIPFMKWQTEVVGSGASWSEQVGRNLQWFGRFAWREGWLLLLPVIWLAPTGWRKLATDARVLCVSGLVFTGVLLFTLIVARELMRENDMLIIYPFLICILVMLSADALRAINTRRGAIVLASLCVLGLFWGARATMDAAALDRKDTRVRAFEWCHDNLPRDITVFREYYTPKLALQGVNEIRMRFLSVERIRIPIERGDHDYLIVSSLAHDRFSDRLQPYYDEDSARFYRTLFETHDVVAEFKDRKMFFAHPDVTVLKKRED